MFDKSLAIVDVETTGMSAQYNRIIEIAVIRIEKNRIVDKFTSLINPQTHISPFIINFTGISERELGKAPVFEEVKDRLVDILSGATFVAHNVRFDYSFIKTELKRVNIPFRAKTCCTVRLSRRLFPQHRSHSLQSIIERFDLSYKSRHRAYDDAHVVWQFLKKVKKEFPRDEVKKTWALLTKSLYSADPEIGRQVDELPEAPGTYLFYDKNNTLLYVGKSKNIHDRVIAHFSQDSLSTKHLGLMKETVQIGYIPAAGELGAMLTESRLVKELHPLYNQSLRQKEAVIILKKQTGKNGYLGFKSETGSIREIGNAENVFRIFNSKSSLKNYLSDLAEEYNLCGKLLGLESGAGSCFNYKLGKCRGACVGKEKKAAYNARFEIAFIENTQFRKWPFKGMVEVVEKGEDEETWEKMTFDNWALVRRENGRGEIEEFEPYFDYDNFVILSGYFRRNKERKLSVFDS